MAKDCSLNYHFSTWKFQAQNNLCTQHVLSLEFSYSTGDSMINLSSYSGLDDARIRASDKYLPVQLRFSKKFDEIH